MAKAHPQRGRRPAVKRTRRRAPEDGGRLAGGLTPAEALGALRSGPVAAALLLDGVVVAASDAFARVLGVRPAAALGRRLEDLVPPDQGPLPTPVPGAVRSFRTHLDGVPARVDLGAAPASHRGLPLVTAVVMPQLEQPDTAADRAMLALSRELAEARTEDELCAALARALEVLFPGRPFCIRLVDPKTLALTTVHARGRLRPHARARVELRRSAVRKTGLSERDLEARGIQLVDRDAPLFEGSVASTSVPLVMGGALFGSVNLEYEPGA
ncbi:MAG TPA: histidine kinase, partial [Anaeromyxobacter sp.]